MSFEEYSKHYLDFLRTEDVSKDVRALALKAKFKTITILCIEEEADNCHRRLRLVVARRE